MGTWALPQTLEQAKQLVLLLAQPLPAINAISCLYSLLGDDDLFDEIETARTNLGEQADIRPLVRSYLFRFLKERERAFKPWDEDAYQLLTNICKSPALFTMIDGQNKTTERKNP
ncbi:hypothetical protein G7B40_039895 [Aetokthonos hydrillicola Thurmond2011]|uniref:Uncharacterized protein n=1 Tax=Aetokthonos hydrillicola Thurmond2011 TaxID=2712845 RepID=A0AAP5IH11_9CYAN|nr:hypothetical protein [Aetokthonos hydrillicola]MBW4590115.1 hypothetical protein [Aetokthonos hydrillicola CCALA 1050]MDR9900654.1 hypothetical protein [Aetokthonos hydrillicola Thurmond2011]